jgi:hypothetical protein
MAPGCRAGRRRAPDLVREGRGEQQVLALLRQQGEHALDVADEAHVEHAVGFVEHQDLDADRSRVFCWTWSSRRPGVATRMSTRLRRVGSICGLMLTPPNITIEVSGVGAVVRTLSSTWAASSRVGVRISARTGARPLAACGAGVAERRCRIGSVKPAVLPVPVWAPASRSPPDSTAGIAWVWMGVGSV